MVSASLNSADAAAEVAGADEVPEPPWWAAPDVALVAELPASVPAEQPARAIAAAIAAAEIVRVFFMKNHGSSKVSAARRAKGLHAVTARYGAACLMRAEVAGRCAGQGTALSLLVYVRLILRSPGVGLAGE
uniref:Uncharacterized protein n=1 Tax=Arthrobacter sp. AK-1 TaxID=415095 RepID=A6YFF0_9MICC|nr:unknown [Arthrobacter sp. AK-1]